MVNTDPDPDPDPDAEIVLVDEPPNMLAKFDIHTIVCACRFSFNSFLSFMSKDTWMKGEDERMHEIQSREV